MRNSIPLLIVLATIILIIVLAMTMRTPSSPESDTDLPEFIQEDMESTPDNAGEPTSIHPLNPDADSPETKVMQEEVQKGYDEQKENSLPLGDLGKAVEEKNKAQ